MNMVPENAVQRRAYMSQDRQARLGTLPKADMMLSTFARSDRWVPLA